MPKRRWSNENELLLAIPKSVSKIEKTNSNIAEKWTWDICLIQLHNWRNLDLRTLDRPSTATVDDHLIVINVRVSMIYLEIFFDRNFLKRCSERLDFFVFYFLLRGFLSTVTTSMRNEVTRKHRQQAKEILIKVQMWGEQERHFIW